MMTDITIIIAVLYMVLGIGMAVAAIIAVCGGISDE